MVLVGRQGIPLGVTITAASPTEVTLAEATLNTRVTPHRAIPDIFYEDGRRLRTYRHRWIIERTIAWFGAFRRLLVRHERSTRMFLAFFQLAAAAVKSRTT
jgi:transposase